MSSLNELLAQKAALEKRIIDAQREEKSTAIAQVKDLMSQHGLSLIDLGNSRGPAAAKRASGAKVAAKYRNTATGDSWSGRGLQPKWLKAALASGKSLADFAL